ncbi:EAL domain-containing protein [Marinobacteraceae bacterium S3BR75-40.1]
MTENETHNVPTLRTVLFLFIGILLIVLLVVSAYSGFARFRDYLADELTVRANDGAVALGLSLSHAVDTSDQAAVASVFNAMFDSSHYSTLQFYDHQQRLIIERRMDTTEYGVPDWFVGLVHLPSPEAQAEVVKGWQQLGQVRVVANPGPAYQDFWKTMQVQALWFLGIAAIALFLASRGVALILRPLRSMERQAHDIENRDFSARVMLPGTRELRRVARSMNQMAEELGKLFQGQLRLIENLRRESQEDPVTGLQNRRAFDQRLQTELEGDETSQAGTLILIQLDGFQAFNTEFGREAGDNLLRQVAGHLRDFLHQHAGAFAGRRGGAEFVLFIPGVGVVDAEHWLTHLLEQLETDYQARAGDLQVAVYAGLAFAGEPEHSRSQLLAQADAALRQAQSETGDRRHHFATVSRALPAERWRERLEQALEKQKLQLIYQPVVDRTDQRVLFNQALSRVVLDGETIAAALFVPVAERYGLTSKLDQLALEQAGAFLEQSPDVAMAVTLASATLAEENFLTYLQDYLRSRPQVAERLWLSIHEEAVRYQPAGVERLIRLAHEVGARVMVDRFGVGGVSFDYLHRWRVDAIRIDRSFIRNIHQRREAVFFLQSILPIAHGRQTQVFVTGVESAEEWSAVQTVDIDGAMGFHLGRPRENPQAS